MVRQSILRTALRAIAENNVSSGSSREVVDASGLHLKRTLLPSFLRKQSRVSRDRFSNLSWTPAFTGVTA